MPSGGLVHQRDAACAAHARQAKPINLIPLSLMTATRHTPAHAGVWEGACRLVKNSEGKPGEGGGLPSRA